MTELIEVTDRRWRREFLEFKRRLYRDDSSYVATAEYTLTPFLNGSTDFARRAECMPLLVQRDGMTIAECILIVAEGLNMVQVGFFEATEYIDESIRLIAERAVEVARARSLKSVVIGLNGHISYGVGVLCTGFGYKNSFDSLYNRRGYDEAWSAISTRTEGLSTYKAKILDAQKDVVNIEYGLTVRKADFRDFYNETERMRAICDRTIGTTNLYFPTNTGHFYELMKDLKPFIAPENLLFAMDGDREVGFLFWHPDFNQTVPAGGRLSLLRAAIGFKFGKGKIETAKLNAIGVMQGYFGRATGALISTALAFAKDYKFVETNFVWDNNTRSTAINRRKLGKPHRTYKVYYIDL